MTEQNEILSNNIEAEEGQKPNYFYQDTCDTARVIAREKNAADFQIEESASSDLSQFLFNKCMNSISVSKTEKSHFGNFASLPDITKAIRSASAFSDCPEKGSDALTVRTVVLGAPNKILLDVLYTAFINKRHYPDEKSATHIYKCRTVYTITPDKDDLTTTIGTQAYKGATRSKIQDYGSKITYLTRYAMRSFFTNIYDSSDDVDSIFPAQTSASPSINSAVATPQRRTEAGRQTTTSSRVMKTSSTMF